MVEENLKKDESITTTSVAQDDKVGSSSSSRGASASVDQDDKGGSSSSSSDVSAPAVKQKGRSKGKQVYEGAAYISCGFNNTLVTITDARGNTLAWSSSGKCGFKGAKKSTPYAGQMVASDAAKIVTDPKTGCGMERIKVYVKGFGSSRDSAIRAIASFLKVTALIDTTGVPFNGCRNSKIRRV